MPGEQKNWRTAKGGLLVTKLALVATGPHKASIGGGQPDIKLASTGGNPLRWACAKKFLFYSFGYLS